MLSGLLLAALLLRAWIPAGFMPAVGTPFLLQLCPAVAAVPAEHAHHHHGGGEHGAAGHGLGHSHFENCPYGSAPAAGPLSQLLAFEAPARAAAGVAAVPDDFAFSAPARRAHLPRGPPSPLA